MKNRLLAVGVVLVLGVSLTQCEQHYRYACQDPDNWNEEYCKRPLCEVNRDCPDLIFKDNKDIQLPSKPLPAPTGDCK